MKVRILGLLLVLVLAISSFGAVTAQDGTIVDIAAGAEDFSTLVSLVEAAGLAETLSGEGPFTVFAPTNDAFAELPEVVVSYLTSDAGADRLSQILLYHVMEGAVTPGESMMAASMDMGNELTVTVDDMGIMIDQANVVDTIEASNGLIHVIDSVLVPPIELQPEDPAFVEGDIVTAGSSTVGPLSEAVQELYVEQGFAGSINNSIIGSGAGFERFCVAGETDISNASRAIRESEIEACQELDPPRNPLEFRVGTDGIAVTVNPANDFASDLTFEELQIAFSTASTWADVREGFPDEEIIRYYPGTDSGTFDFFVEEVFDEDPEPLLNSSNGNPNEDDNVLLEGVANNQYAIGFFGYAYYQANADALGLLAIDSVEPNIISVEDGTYVLARPLFIYSDAGIIAEKPQVGEFIKFYLANVNDVIDEVGYFPANPFGLNRAKLVIEAATTMGMM